MSKDSRLGGKFNGNHTTLTHLAAIVCDIAEKCPEVTKISPGFLTAGLRSVNGQRRVKIVQHPGMIFLSIRDNTSHQEVHVYASKVQPALEWIARGVRDEEIAICFEKKQKKATTS